MLISLDPVVLPIPVNLNITTEPTFSTTVLGDVAGGTQSLINRDLAVWTWTLKFLRHADDFGDMIGFFLGRQGRGYGGLFKDPLDNTSTDNKGVGKVKTLPDGKRYLVKQYTDSWRPYCRLITCPVAETLSFSGVSGSPVLVPYTGEITGATSDGDATFDFVCPFVFQSDSIKIESVPVVGEVGSLTLREIYRFVVSEAP